MGEEEEAKDEANEMREWVRTNMAADPPSVLRDNRERAAKFVGVATDGSVAAAGLPKQLGAASQANARRVSLSYDGKDSTLTLAPGGGDLSAIPAAAANDAAAALLDLADQVKAMTAR